MIMTEQAVLFSQSMEITLPIHCILKAKITADPITGNLSEEILRLVGWTEKFCISSFLYIFRYEKPDILGMELPKLQLIL